MVWRGRSCQEFFLIQDITKGFVFQTVLQYVQNLLHQEYNNLFLVEDKTHQNKSK